MVVDRVRLTHPLRTVPRLPDLVALRQQFPFLAALSHAGAQRLERQLEWREAKPTTQLVCRGDRVGGVFLVLSGSIRVYFVHPGGKEGTLYFVDAGQACFLSVHSVLERQPYDAWAEADTEPVRFAIIPAAIFRSLAKTELALQSYALEVLSLRVSEMMRTVESTAACSLEARLASWVLERTGERDVLRMSQERLARHLGTAREVVVRILRTLRSRGIVSTERGTVRILDRARLETLRE